MSRLTPDGDDLANAAWNAAEGARAAAMHRNLRNPDLWRLQALILALGALKLSCAVLLLAVAAAMAGFDRLQATLVGVVIALPFVPLCPSLFGKNLFKELADQAFQIEMTRYFEDVRAKNGTFARETNG